MSIYNGSSDLLVISLDIVDPEALERLVVMASRQLVKPEATVVVTTSSQAAASNLGRRGFHVISDLSDSSFLALYIFREHHPRNVVNSAPPREVVIFEPSTSSSYTQEFSAILQSCLQNQGYSVLSKQWGSEITALDIEGKINVSLLELEEPLLDNLSEHDFKYIKILISNCERLLWITSGKNPAFGMIDGFARCMISENAGIKVQLLHLSDMGRLQHGPSLASRLLQSNSVDNEYKEVEGVLQVSRIRKSY